MDISRFSDSPIGSLAPITISDPRFDGTFHHYAYVPEPLPEDIQLSSGTWSIINDAALALGRLDAATSQLPNPLLLVRPAIRKEAVSTSALEGTYAEIEELFESEILEEHGRGDVQEVRNYVRASELGFKHLEEQPISLPMLTELQKVLVQNTRGATKDAGKVREQQVWIGPKDEPVTHSNFVPPPPGPDLDESLRKWVDWVYKYDNPLPLLVRVAMAHYQFETLHPFTDGNGRIGRLIAILQLVEAGALKHPTLYISPWLERRREDYQEHLRRVSASGDFDPWVAFFGEAIRAQSTDALDRTQRLLELRDSMVSRLRAEGVKGVALPIAEELIGYPVLNPTEASKQHNVSYQAANQAIMKLCELGMLTEMTGRRYARIFGSEEVLRIIR